jgi:hypothetical protein
MNLSILLRTALVSHTPRKHQAHDGSVSLHLLATQSSINQNCVLEDGLQSTLPHRCALHLNPKLTGALVMPAADRISVGIVVIVACTAVAGAQTIINAPPTAIPSASIGYEIPAGTTLNIFENAQIFRTLQAQANSTVNIYGSELTQSLTANGGATVNIYDGNPSGGLSGELFLSSGSQTTMRGGRFSQPIFKQAGATLIIEGIDFALNGVPVVGLNLPGDEASILVPDETLFTGIFANGAPFTFDNRTSSGDRIFGDVILRQTPRPLGPTTVTLPADPLPVGVLPGQTLIVNPGAELPNGFNAGPGSVVHFQGGSAQVLEAYGATVNFSNGLVSNGLTAYMGSNIHITGGSVFSLNARQGAHVQVDNGSLQFLSALEGSNVQVDGGEIFSLGVLERTEVQFNDGLVHGELRMRNGSTFHMLGGWIEPLVAIPSGAKLLLSGGRVGTGEYTAIDARSGAELTLFGKQFSLGSDPIVGLVNPGDSLIFASRPNLAIEGTLAGGSPLKLYVGTQLSPPGSPVRGIIAPGATLRLVVVAEPSAITCATILLLGLSTYRRGSCFRKVLCTGMSTTFVSASHWVR